MAIGQIRLAQARWLLGSLSPEALVEVAGKALELGIDSPSLRRLAGETRPTRHEIQPLWATTLAEGARASSQECCDLMGSRSRLDTFAILASRHEDYRFAGSDSGASSRYDQEVQHCEREILREARALLSESTV
jgi:hypothetical protein